MKEKKLSTQQKIGKGEKPASLAQIVSIIEAKGFNVTRDEAYCMKMALNVFTPDNKFVSRQFTSTPGNMKEFQDYANSLVPYQTAIKQATPCVAAATAKGYTCDFNNLSHSCFLVLPNSSYNGKYSAAFEYKLDSKKRIKDLRETVNGLQHKATEVQV